MIKGLSNSGKKILEQNKDILPITPSVLVNKKEKNFNMLHNIKKVNVIRHEDKIDLGLDIYRLDLITMKTVDVSFVNHIYHPLDEYTTE